MSCASEWVAAVMSLCGAPTCPESRYGAPARLAAPADVILHASDLHVVEVHHNAAAARCCRSSLTSWRPRAGPLGRLLLVMPPGR